jgi:Domain of unknown function (DUF4381)
MNSDPASLDRLHDVIAPPPIPPWPPPTGWSCVLGMLLLVAIYFLIKALLHWQHNRYRREALAEWHRHRAHLADTNTRIAAVGELAILLKRTALSAFSRTEVASLTGTDWLNFLDRTARMNDFTSEVGGLLENAAYGCVHPSQLDEARANNAAQLVHRWILRHRLKQNY